MLTRQEAQAFYDRFGAKQDQQGFYEDVATRDLIAHADFAGAHAVFEFGCGTGRFAAQLLGPILRQNATYVGCDVSTTMVGLARERLARFGERVRVVQSDGSMRLDAVDGTIDRFVSNYVLDLLSPDDIIDLISEVRRVLTPAGRLCLVSLAHGPTVLSGFVSWAWARLHRMRPSLVGGCRPINLREFLSDSQWDVAYRNVVVAFGIPSEVVVARKRDG